MKAVIPENLVSIYDLTVPYALDVRKLRRQLDAELEKLHPCFPSQCAVDYRLCFQMYGKSAAGFHIRAVVMDRLALAAIRKKNAGRFLYTAGSHPYRVFSRELLYKRLCLAVVAVLTAIIVMSGIRILRLKRMPALSEVAEADSFTASAGNPACESAFPETEGDAACPETRDLAPFFSGIYEKGGTLSSLSWNADTGTLSFKTDGLFPEQLAAAADQGELLFGPVSYNGGRPEAEVTLITMPYEQKMPASGFELSETDTGVVFMSGLRELFSESGGYLLSETVTPPSLTGSIPEASWASFAAGLEEAAAAGFRLFSLSRLNGSILVTLELSERAAVLPLSNLECVFADAPGMPFAPEKADEWAAAVSEKREIGRIEREDGSSVVFFHNSEGKIERRVYEN